CPGVASSVRQKSRGSPEQRGLLASSVRIRLEASYEPAATTSLVPPVRPSSTYPGVGAFRKNWSLDWSAGPKPISSSPESLMPLWLLSKKIAALQHTMPVGGGSSATLRRT